MQSFLDLVSYSMQTHFYRCTALFSCPRDSYVTRHTFSSSSSSFAWWMSLALPPNRSIFSPDVKKRPAGISVGRDSHDGWNHHKVQSLFLTPALRIESVKWKWVLLFLSSWHEKLGAHVNDGSQTLERHQIRRKTGENKNNSEDQNRFGQRRDSLKEKQTGQSFVR